MEIKYSVSESFPDLFKNLGEHASISDVTNKVLASVETGQPFLVKYNGCEALVYAEKIKKGSAVIYLCGLAKSSGEISDDDRSNIEFDLREKLKQYKNLI